MKIKQKPTTGFANSLNVSFEVCLIIDFVVNNLSIRSLISSFLSDCSLRLLLSYILCFSCLFFSVLSYVKAML